MKPRAALRLATLSAAALALAAATDASAQLLPPLESDEAAAPKPPQPPLVRSSGILWADLALRSSLMHVEGPGGKVTTEGGMASLDLSFTVNVRSFEEALRCAGAIGGGGGGASAGVEGEFRGDLLFGWRGYVTDEQGPFLRAGAVSRILSYPAFRFEYAGGVGEGGYQYVDKRVAFEVGLQGGGSSDGALLGAFASMGAGRVMLRMEWQHFLPSGGELDDLASSSGCFVIGSAFPLCLTTWSVTGGSRVQATYGGVSFGIGAGVVGMHHEGERPPAPPTPSSH